MTWWDYVMSVTGGATHEVVARAAGVTPPSVTRWKTYTPKPETVSTFAKAYERPVLEAFVAAGFLTPAEAGERPTERPSLATWSDDELLDEVRKRLKGEPGAGTTPAEKKPQPPPVTEIGSRRPVEPDWEAMAADVQDKPYGVPDE